MTAKTSALYYPFIDIENEKWLKSAFLYWDEIRTIVPESNKNPYKSRLSEELSDDGFLVPLHVESGMDEIESLTEKVLDYITDPRTEDLICDTPDAELFRMYPDKMPSEFRRMLEFDGSRFGLYEDKLPFTIKDRLQSIKNDGCYYLPKNFANFYMTILASSLADRLGIALVTESINADQLAISIAKGKRAKLHGRFGRAYEAYGPRKTLPPEASQALLIETAIEGFSMPDNIPLGKIKKFKKDHYGELAEFRKGIEKLSTEIGKSDSIESARQQVQDQYTQNILPAIKSLKSSIKAESWESGLNGLIKIMGFTVPSTSAAMWAGAPANVAIAAGTGFTVVATATNIYNRYMGLKKSPYTYLLSAEKFFGRNDSVYGE